MWVERLVDEWIATSSPMFATEWPGFHKFARGLSLMTFFNGSLLAAGLEIFASPTWNYREYIILIMLLIMLYEIYFIKH